MIVFTPVEIISLGVAIISIVLNIIQWQKQRIFYKPIYNALVGLFNDIKTKQIDYYTRQKQLESRVYSAQDLNEITHSFSAFIRETTVDFEGVKEHLVAALKTMNPSEEEIFKASDFGLTSDDKRRRDEFLKRM
jgi:hypothetical protein